MPSRISLATSRKSKQRIPNWNTNPDKITLNQRKSLKRLDRLMDKFVKSMDTLSYLNLEQSEALIADMEYEVMRYFPSSWPDVQARLNGLITDQQIEGSSLQTDDQECDRVVA
jgi:hypothetical protein